MVEKTENKGYCRENSVSLALHAIQRLIKKETDKKLLQFICESNDLEAKTLNAFSWRLFHHKTHTLRALGL
jgi:hypothetical protein